MPNFIYTSKNKRGETQIGHLESKDKHELASLLRNQGLVLISAEMAGVEKSVSYFNIKKIVQKLGHISLVEKMMFSRHLSVMIKAGLSLSQALKVLARQTKSPKFSKIINQIEDGIRQGKSFSESLAQHPKVFDNLFVSMVQIGETSGNLNEVLEILAEQMRKNHELVSRVKGAMVYPAVIVVAMIGIGILMMVLVVPQLTSVFSELNIELPLSTRIIIGLSNFLKDNLILTLIALILLIILIRFIIKIKKVKSILDRIFLYLPIFGPLIQKINSARFSRTFSSLIESGVPIVKSLKIVGETLGNVHFKKALLDSAQQVQRGEALSVALGKYENLYMPMVTQMISVGEETGNISGVLESLADFYEEEIDNTTKNLSAVLEPVIMIVVGAAVAFFAVSMIQPMYSMMGGI